MISSLQWRVPYSYEVNTLLIVHRTFSPSGLVIFSFWDRSRYSDNGILRAISADMSAPIFLYWCSIHRGAKQKIDEDLCRSYKICTFKYYFCLLNSILFYYYCCCIKLYCICKMEFLPDNKLLLIIISLITGHQRLLIHYAPLVKISA